MQKRKSKWHKVCTMKGQLFAREMQAKLDNVEAERIKAVQALQNERQLRENAIQDLEVIKQAHGVSMDEKTTVLAEAKRKEEVLSAEVHRLETEVSQMKSELHNAKEEIQMAQSLHNEKDNSAREMQAKLDNVEAERIKAVQALQNERQLRENAIQDLEAIKQAHGVSMDEKTTVAAESDINR